MSEPVIKVDRISHVGMTVKDCEKTAAFLTRMFEVGPFDPAQTHAIADVARRLAEEEPVLPTPFLFGPVSMMVNACDLIPPGSTSQFCARPQSAARLAFVIAIPMCFSYAPPPEEHRRLGER